MTLSYRERIDRELRREPRIRQRQIADRLGMRETVLSDLLNGRRAIDLQTFNAIIAAAKVIRSIR